MQHHVVILRPPSTVDSLGNRTGSPTVVCPEWPCQILPAGHRETEGQNKTEVSAIYEVHGYGDPQWENLSECWLEILPDRQRKLQILSVIDVRTNGLRLRMLCGES